MRGALGLSRSTLVYIGATLAVAGYAIMRPAGLHFAIQQPFLVLACLLLTLLSEVGRVRITDNVSISGTALVGELAILVLPPSAATFAVLVGVVLGQRLAGIQRSKTLFNGALFALCTWAASLAFHAIGGQLDMPVTSQLLLPYAAMLVAWNLTNVLVLGGLLATVHGRSPVSFWMSIERSILYNQIVFAVMGLFMESIFVQMGLLGILFIFLMLLAVRMAFQLYANNRNFYREITGVLERTLAFKDPVTGSHSERVADLAAEIGKELGIVDSDLDLLRHAALLHDVGKVAVPDAILGKPGPLDPTERSTMDLHVEAADNILETSRYLEPLAEMVRGHHERLDGKGYPDQVEGGDIPLASRIIAVADAYDAMTQDRPYRAALPTHEVVLRLQAGVGTQFDPTVVRALFRIKGFSEAIPATASVADPGPAAELADPGLAQAAGSEVAPVPVPSRRTTKRKPKQSGA